MPKIICLPDNTEFPIEDGETILKAALRANVPHAHACGGHARCSTCRVWILEGLENCLARADQESRLAGPLGFGPEVRLACQTVVAGDVKLRRLVLDETDLEIASQLAKQRFGRCGESRMLVILFCDIRDFTNFSQQLSPYDVMFVLNRYFLLMADVIERHGGYVDKFIGDEMMALFGIDDRPHAPLRATQAATEMLHAADRLKPYMDAMYGRHFEVGIGLHYGEAVVGTLGSSKHGRLTAIGDAVNVASRIEGANKEVGTRLLISEELYQEVKDDVVVADFVRVKLRGTAERRTLYEIARVDPAALAKVPTAADDTRQHLAGLDWVRLLPEAELPVGERRVIERDDFDLLLIRTPRAVYALNNACPHLHLPLSDSSVTDEDVIVCRWHESRYALDSGEVLSWCPALNADGSPKGFEFVGNVSKNQQPLKPIPVRIDDGHIWVAID